MTFIQHSIFGPIASIVLVDDSNNDSESIFIFSVFDEALRKRITSTEYRLTVAFTYWNTDNALFFGGRVLQKDGTSLVTFAHAMLNDGTGEVELPLEYERQTDYDQEQFCSLSLFSTYYVALTLRLD